MNLKDLDINRIYRAFSPAREIEDPKQFAGRKEELKNGIMALHNKGGFMSIFGLRGVGKSSIANQITLIARGDTVLPEMLYLGKFLPKNKPFNFIVHTYRSDGFINDVGDLFKRILFGDEKNPSLFSLTKAGERRLDEFKRTLSVEGGVGVFGTKIESAGSESSTYKPYVSDDLIQQFRSLIGTIQRDNHKKDGLLILIDEFDTIPDKRGFASIVKACSSDFIKFGIIGIATSVTELIKEHTSIGRQIDIIEVPRMPEEELGEILKRAEHTVDHAIVFDTDAANEITTRSEGFPYFTHLLGRESMIMAFENESPKVTIQIVNALYEKISKGRLKSIYEDIYHSAVKNSPQREIILKAFSERNEEEINTETVYDTAKGMNISNPSQLMRQLTTSDSSSSPVLVKVREKHFRFSDPVFKVYARIRNWKF